MRAVPDGRIAVVVADQATGHLVSVLGPYLSQHAANRAEAEARVVYGTGHVTWQQSMCRIEREEVARVQ